MEKINKIKETKKNIEEQNKFHGLFIYIEINTTFLNTGLNIKVNLNKILVNHFN